MEIRKSSYTTGENVGFFQPLWRTVRRYLKKTRNRATISTGNPTPEHISRENP